MEVVIIPAVAFLAAILTFFSGFGLGTLLTPVFMLFFPVELAIALTGLVHFANNIFKLLLVGKGADREVLIRFGIPAVIAALAGSWLLLHLPAHDPLFTYSLYNKTVSVYPVKFIVSVLLIIFACMEFIPYFKNLRFERNKLPLGGVLSGFFGGLSGNQGALRSAFLVKAGLTKETFIATTVVISACVDMTRLGVYATKIGAYNLSDHATLLIVSVLAAICGAFIGNSLLKKVTLSFVQTAVAIMLIGISLAMGAGFI